MMRTLDFFDARQRGSTRFLVIIAVLGALITTAPSTYADICQQGSGELISISWDDGPSDSRSLMPVKVSGTGRFVLFASRAKNLVSADQAPFLHPEWNLFVRDRAVGTTTVVGRGLGGGAPNQVAAGSPDMDASGRWILFASHASNLVPGDTNGSADVFLFDRLTTTTRLISRPDKSIRQVAGQLGNGNSGWEPHSQPRISPNGEWAVIPSSATNLTIDNLNGVYGPHLYRLNVIDESVQLITKSVNPDYNKGMNFGSAAVGNDGTIVFRSSSPYLVEGLVPPFSRLFVADTNGEVEAPTHLDEFYLPSDLDLDAAGEVVTFVTTDYYSTAPSQIAFSKLSGGNVPVAPGTGWSPKAPEISEDGKYVAYGDYSRPDSSGFSLIRQEVCWQAGACETVNIGPGESTAGISGDGSVVAFYWASPDGAPSPGKHRDIVAIGDDPGTVCKPHVLDPNSSLVATSATHALLDPASSTGVVQNLSTVVSQPFVGEPTSVATDGETRLVLAWETPGPGHVQVRALDETGLARAGTVGSLSEPYPGTTEITLPVEPLAGGGYGAGGLYWVPKSYVRQDAVEDNSGQSDTDDSTSLIDVSSTSRLLDLEFTFFPQDGGDPIVEVVGLDLVRPPLVFVHGIWSDAGTWQWPLVQDPRFKSALIEYPNDEAYLDNVPRIRAEIGAILRQYRDEGLAVTQLVAIGHSMGGQLLRRHGAGTSYIHDPPALPFLRAENFMQGDLDRYISVDSPHHGSPLADIGMTLVNSSIPGLSQGAVAILCALEMCPQNGALEDLTTSSDEVVNMPAVQNLDAHLMVGVGGEDWLEAQPIFGPLYKLVKFLSFHLVSLDTVMGGPHDLLVEASSQRSGLASSALGVSTFQYLDSENTAMHIDNTKEPRYGGFVEGLLNLPSDEVDLSFRDDLPGGGAATSSGSWSLRLVHVANLAIASPPSGTILEPGTSVEVRIDASAGFEARRIMIVCGDTPHEFLAETSTDDGRGTSTVLDDPFTTHCYVPEDHFGPYTIFASAYDAAEELAVSETLSLDVVPSAAVKSIRPYEPRLTLAVDQSADIRVLALFDDGVEREIPANDPALTLTSSKAEIADVSGGKVSGISPGFAILTIGYQQFSATQEVAVHEF